MSWQPVEPTPEEVSENLKRYRERVVLYREFGHDREKAIRFIVDFAEPIKSPVLDIGCGKGFAAVELARRGVSVDSIDISEDELRTALLNAKSAGVDRLINFHIGDANELPFEDEHFRLVTMVNLIHHVESYGGILGEVSRVLGPGGKFLVSDFTGEGFDILDRIHESEGRVHPRPGRNGIDDVAGSLSDFGLQCLGRDIRFQEYVMLAEKL